MKELSETDRIKNTGQYIGFIDLVGLPPYKLTIADVVDVSGDKVDGVRPAKPGTYALKFKETGDRMLLIQGKRKKFIIHKFGAKKSELIGQSVEIYADPSVKFAGKAVGGLKFLGMED